MGWTYEHKPPGETARENLTKKFTFESEAVKNTVLDCAIVNLKTAYLAVEQIETATAKREVYGAVCLLDYRPHDHFNFGLKDMDEGMGPAEDACPARILDLLTEPANERARGWRERCRAHIDRRQAAPALKTGFYLKLNEPLSFANGDRRDTFYIVNARRRLASRAPSRFADYRLPTKDRLARIGYEVVDKP